MEAAVTVEEGLADMAVDYSIMPWQREGGRTDASAGLQRVLGMLAQQQQMKQQADTFTANKKAAAEKAQAQAQLQQALSQIDPKDPDAQRKASMLMLQFSPLLGGGGGAAAALKGMAPPPKPQQIQQVPIPGGQPAPQTPFKGLLDSILKGAGVTPKTPAPPSANAVFDPNKGTYRFPPALNRPPTKPPMPRQQAIPRVPTGSTWSGPGTPPPHFETPVKPTAPKPDKPGAFDLQTHSHLLSERLALIKEREAAQGSEAKAAVDEKLQDNWADIQELEKKGENSNTKKEEPKKFKNENEARNLGKAKAGDEVYLEGVGLVRLK